MTKISAAMLDDGRTLENKFNDAEELIDAGDLNFTDFTSPLVRKVIYLQKELSKSSGRPQDYDERNVDDFRNRTKRFLTDLKDGAVTDGECREISKRMKATFPKFQLPKSIRK